MDCMRKFSLTRFKIRAMSAVDVSGAKHHADET